MQRENQATDLIPLNPLMSDSPNISRSPAPVEAETSDLESAAAGLSNSAATSVEVKEELTSGDFGVQSFSAADHGFGAPVEQSAVVKLEAEASEVEGERQ